ncbi:flagellar hook protein FliD [Paraburkholderia sp. UYCP14C]|uniref:flagellar filament capping protein FliD n=1 Tax=Paraburkholderia sp. UYCP14C TaxID=2511130 RepID=UPI001021A973|nr:flagellar filament capping protein FliD [Paraburkholderia sp. UYCP14C]RZF28047.1 flagellar hook protein FliD [Paraburkholderia sp. UYCP14C]
MSTVSSSSVSSLASSAAAASNTALQQAAQSIISGSTGNSSMDVSSLVTALVNSKIAGQAAALSAKATQDNTAISAYGTLSAGLSALQAGLTSLSNGTTLNQFTATADGSGLTATAASGAVAGTYAIGVTQIATAQVLSSQAFNPPSTTLGTGTMTLSVGGKSTTISIDSTNNTVAGIAAAINSASNNPGITASVVTGVDGAHLVLHSSSTGASNVINVSVSDTNASDPLNSLAVTSKAGDGTTSGTASQSTLTSGAANTTTGTAGWTQTTAAQNAYITVDGTAATSSTNTVTSALSGVTLNLTQAAVGSTTQNLTVSQNTTAQLSTIDNFVSLYNTLVTTMGTLTAYSSSSTSQGALLGDSTLNMIQNSLASIVANGVKTGTNTTSLASIGITLQADGSLSVDNTQLSSALQNNQSTVATLFNSTNGVAEQLNTNITSYLATGGAIATRTTALNNDLTSLSTQQSTLSDYEAQLTSQYNAQFTALNTLMATMNNNAQYLTQLFGGTNSQGAMSANKS